MTSMKHLRKTALLSGMAAFFLSFHAFGAPKLPDPAPGALSLAASPAKEQTIVLAGGCFWGIQAVYQHVKGVKEAVSGYSGGTEDKANYEMVSEGDTGHAESVRVTYDPAQVSLGQLLKVYFSVAHNPTQLNYQESDHGTQYRSEIYFTTPEQQKIAQSYIAQLDAAKVYSDPIVTKLEPLKAFYPAEDYHQNYATLHPENPYIMFHDLPKIKNLKSDYPDLYVGG